MYKHKSELIFIFAGYCPRQLAPQQEALCQYASLYGEIVSDIPT
jgi:hypothetical protein